RGHGGPAFFRRPVFPGRRDGAGEARAGGRRGPGPLQGKCRPDPHPAHRRAARGDGLHGQPQYRGDAHAPDVRPHHQRRRSRESRARRLDHQGSPQLQGFLMAAPALPMAATPPDIHAHRILILDFGAQYSQLIARRVRELGVYCELHPWDVTDAEIRAFQPRGVILTGGPESVTDSNPPKAPESVFTLGVPVLGICYGMQTMAQQLGGRVAPSTEREFGYAEVTVTGANRLLEHLEDRRDTAGRAVLDVWMSHGDRVNALPEGFTVTASTASIPFAAMADERRRLYG